MGWNQERLESKKPLGRWVHLDLKWAANCGHVKGGIRKK